MLIIGEELVMSLKILLQKQSINYSISNEKTNTQALLL